MKTKIIEGFTFKYVGDFFINPVKSSKRYKWTDEQKNERCEHITTCIRFVENDLDKQKEVAYIVTVDDKLVYVGEFSNSFRYRWLKVDNYIWHHKDHLIHKALRNKSNVSLWFIADPYVNLSSVNLNISKSIEHHILKNINTDWNIRNNQA